MLLEPTTRMKLEKDFSQYCCNTVFFFILCIFRFSLSPGLLKWKYILACSQYATYVWEIYSYMKSNPT